MAELRGWLTGESPDDLRSIADDLGLRFFAASAGLAWFSVEGDVFAINAFLERVYDQTGAGK